MKDGAYKNSDMFMKCFYECAKLISLQTHHNKFKGKKTLIVIGKHISYQYYEKIDEPPPVSHFIWYLNLRKIRTQTVAKIIKCGSWTNFSRTQKALTKNQKLNLKY